MKHLMVFLTVLVFCGGSAWAQVYDLTQTNVIKFSDSHAEVVEYTVTWGVAAGGPYPNTTVVALPSTQVLFSEVGIQADEKSFTVVAEGFELGTGNPVRVETKTIYATSGLQTIFMVVEAKLNDTNNTLVASNEFNFAVQ